MSQTKAQLIQPIGIVTAGGVVVTGVVTASSFDGDVVGSATSIISGSNLNLGDVNATTFSGDFTGNATGIITGAAIKVGSFTATSFTGDFTGTATSMMRGTGFKAGAINATGFNVSGTSAGTIAGNVTGDVTGDVTGVSTGNVTGNVTGNITGYAKSVTSGNNIHVGVLTAITFSGDGSNLTGIAATNFNTQVVPGLTFSINVTSPAGGNYTLSGTDRSGTVSGSSDPAVTVEIGDTLNFVVDASGHPFYIRNFSGGDNVSTPAATNQGSQSGTVSWTPNTAGTYYYQCGNHAGMLGTITVTATTTIDLSAGNCITFNQSATTTVAFANTSTAMDVTLIREKDGDGNSFSSGAVNFDGTGDYLSMATSSDLSFGTGDYTVECWVRPTSVSGTLEIVLNTGGYDNSTFYFHYDNNQLSVGNLNAYISNQPATFENGKWYHIVACRSGSTLKLFQNGTQVGSDATDNTNWASGGPILIGAQDGPVQTVNGEISNLRVLKGTALYTSDFTPPFADLTNISGTVLLCCQDTSSTTVGAVKPGTITANGDPTAGSVTIDPYESNLNFNITWPNSVKWNGGSAPTLISSYRDGDRQQFQLLTRDGGLTWYAWESFGYDLTSNKMFMWGANEYATLGQNDRAQKSSPTQVGSNVNWLTVVAGSNSSYAQHALKTDGTLWAWGRNNYGQLGQNQGSDQLTGLSSPTQISGTWAASQFAGGGGIKAVKSDGTFWCWGTGSNGGFGLNNQVQYSSPTQVGTDTDWGTGDGMVGGTDYASLMIKTDGTLWTFGTNEYGELGHNNRTNRSSPTQIPGTTWATVGRSGQMNSSAIKTDGTLWTWGRNSYGQLGIGQPDNQHRSSPTLVSGTGYSRVQSGTYRNTMATRTDGTLWIWGYNTGGVLGQNNGTPSTNPVQIPGTNWATGSYKFDVAGNTAGCFKTDGTFWIWGEGDKGQLGNNIGGPGTKNRSSPIQVGTTTKWNNMNMQGQVVAAIEFT